MKRIITLLVLVALLAVIVPAAIGCSEASDEDNTPPAEETSTPADEPVEPVTFEIAGTMETTQQVIDPEPTTEEDQMTFENTDYWDVQGTLEGTLVVEYTMIIDTTKGTITSEGQGTFTGTVDGISGSFVYDISGSGYFTNLEGTAGKLTTDETIVSGTGSLANLQGSSHSVCTFDANGSSGTYSGTCWFEE
jgi:hypothetical protein